MTRRIAILNDTSTRSHHGCARVMRLLTAGLEARGARITARSAARNDWANDPGFMAGLAEADTVVINGEGTLHHGRPAGARLLSIADHPAARGKRLALVNALYDENPADWGAWLAKFDLLFARDSRSAEELRRASGRAARWLPDLSLSAGGEAQSGAANGVLIGDSVRLEHRRALARLAERSAGARMLPTKTRAHPAWHAPLIGPALKTPLYALYNGRLTLRRPPFDLAPDEPAYLAALRSAALHVTGRFHGVCLSLVTGTPFLAVDSVSSKIARLLDDLGLDRSRLIAPDAMPHLTLAPEDYAFSPAERATIAAALSGARAQAAEMFDEICA